MRVNPIVSQSSFRGGSMPHLRIAKGISPTEISRKCAKFIDGAENAKNLGGAAVVPPRTFGSDEERGLILGIELFLKKRYGINANFKSNPIIAKSTAKVASLYDTLFLNRGILGMRFLPKNVEVAPLESRNIIGEYNCIDDKVTFNEDAIMFFSNFDLYFENLKNAHIFRPNDTASVHPSHPFVHEFAHAAHWKNMVQRNGYDKALKVWRGFVGVTVPTVVGRLITRYKLGNYSVDGMDMCEFMAERVSHDICNSLGDTSWQYDERPDVEYETVYRRNWLYRYQEPQSYLDYYTEQVWNGDVEGADEAVKRIEEFLLTSKPPSRVQKVKEKAHTLKQKINNAMTDVMYSVEDYLEKTKQALLFPVELYRMGKEIKDVLQMKEIEPKTDVHPTVSKITEHIKEEEKTKVKTEDQPSFLSKFSDVLEFGNRIITRKLDERNTLRLNNWEE